MSYDIPDEIKYKEKIVFNLDFKQLGYFCIFGLLAFFSMSLPIQGDAKMILPIFLCVLGLGFVFLNLEEKILDTYSFYGGVRKAKSKDPKAQALIGIKAIENDAVYLANGDLRAILQVEPINFSLLDESQKKAVILNYREFLNHLTTSIQVLVKTSEPDLTKYFEEAQKKLKDAPSELCDLFDDFMAFEQNFLAVNNVRERSYFVVVSHEVSKSLLGKVSPKTDEELKLLEQKTKIIQEKLAACGLQSKRLENKDLRTFFLNYSSREQDSSAEQAAVEVGGENVVENSGKTQKTSRHTVKARSGAKGE